MASDGAVKFRRAMPSRCRPSRLGNHRGAGNGIGGCRTRKLARGGASQQQGHLGQGHRGHRPLCGRGQLRDAGGLACGESVQGQGRDLESRERASEIAALDGASDPSRRHLQGQGFRQVAGRAVRPQGPVHSCLRRQRRRRPVLETGKPETQPSWRFRKGQGPSSSVTTGPAGPRRRRADSGATPRPTGTGKASRRAVGSSSPSRSKAVPSEPTSARPGT